MEKLKIYIKRVHGTQRAFAADQGVFPSQVTQWLVKGFVVHDGVLYSPRRELNKNG